MTPARTLPPPGRLRACRNIPRACTLLALGAMPALSSLAGESAPDTEPAWTFGVSALTYFVPDDRDYVQPTISVDRDHLHFEARYNYENLETGSLWLGWNLAFGDRLALEFTPMLGGVLGDQTGVAPGLLATLSWGPLEWYVEAEYVCDTDDTSESFFYSWSELSVYPVRTFRVGLVVQRTRLYQTDFDVQRGVLAGFSRGGIDVTGYVLNPDDDPVIVLGVGLNF